MILTSDLMGLGLPPQLAARLGWTAAATVAGSGTAQKTDAAAITASNLLALGLNNVTTDTGATAVQIPSTMPVGSSMVVNVTSSTTAVLFPPASGTINGAAANAKVDIAQNKPTLVIRVTSVIFLAIIGA